MFVELMLNIIVRIILVIHMMVWVVGSLRSLVGSWLLVFRFSIIGIQIFFILWWSGARVVEKIVIHMILRSLVGSWLLVFRYSVIGIQIFFILWWSGARVVEKIVKHPMTVFFPFQLFFLDLYL